jgi:hypothetical protein
MLYEINDSATECFLQNDDQNERSTVHNENMFNTSFDYLLYSNSKTNVRTKRKKHVMVLFTCTV